jgi:chitinase
VFYGLEGQSPTSRPIGTNLTTTISNVVRGATYDITAEAYTSGGNLVHDYEVVTYTIPQSGSIGSVHLIPVDQPPSITLTSPADGTTFGVPANIQITAEAFDDDAVKFVDVFAGTNLLARDSAAPYSFTWTNPPAGEHEISAIAVDTLDQFTRASSAFVTVDTAPVTTGPAAPSNLTGRFIRSNRHARLDWVDASNNEDSFTIERSTDNSNFTAIATVPANTIQYFDSAVTRGARYYYRVRSVNSAGSNVSNVVSVRARW